MLASGGSLENKIKPMPKYVYGVWLVCWVMFGLSFFTSKSGLSIFSSLLIITAVFYLDWKSFLREKWLVLYVLSLPLGMFFNLFSLGGWRSSLHFFLTNPWPLIVLPIYILLQSEKDWKYFLYPLLISLLGAIAKAMSVFYLQYGFKFTNSTRVDSFFDIGRWGQFIASAALVWFILSYPKMIKSRRIAWLSRTVFVLSLLFLGLSNTRGPWLGFAVGAGLAVVLARRYLKTVFVGAFVVIAMLLTLNGVHQRAKSIFMVAEDNEGRITSEDNSNAGRLHMWKVALDRVHLHPFFGTGYGNSEQPMRDFLANQGQDYLNKYTKVQFSYKDAHSSYLQSLIEMGFFFFIYYWGFLLIFCISQARYALRESDSFSIVAASVVMLNLVVYLFYSSFSTYENLLVALAVCCGKSNRWNTAELSNLTPVNETFFKLLRRKLSV